MKTRRGDIQALATIIGVLVVIGGVAIAAYFLHGNVRRNHLTERNYRALAMASEQLRERLDGLRVAIATDARSKASTDGREPPSEAVAFTCEPYDKQATTPDLPGTTSASSEVGTSPAATDGTRMAIELDDQHRSLDAYVAYDPDCDENEREFPNAFADEPAAAGKETPQTKDDTRKVKDVCQQAQERYDDPCKRCAACRPTCEGGVCKRIALRDYLEGVVPDQALFDSIILTIGDESIVLQGSLEKDAKLGTVLAEDAVKEEPKSSGDEAKKIAPVERPTGTPDVTLQGEKYYRFTTPIGVSPFVSSIPNAPGNLRLHGLVRTAVFDRDTHRIGDNWVLGLLLVLVLAGLSWPLLKLWYMGPAERLRGFDVRILTLAMTVMAGVVTLFIVQLAWQRALTDWFDRQLEDLATQVVAIIDKDFTDAIHTLAGAENPKAQVPDSKYHDFDLIVAIGENAKPIQRCSPMQHDGRWQLQRRSTPALRVSDRQYFKDVLSENYGYTPANGPGYALEVVRSKTTGDLQVVLARRAAAVERDERAPQGNAASPVAHTVLIGMNASRILRASLPFGFQFAIVDATGAVQLHSDARRSRVENVLDQCDRSGELAAALKTGESSHPLTIDYGGNSHRAVVRTIPHTPWRLVVFESDAVAERVNDEIVALWAVMFLAYVGFILIVVLAVQVIDDGYRAEWIWPDRGFAHLYAPTALRLLITAAVLRLAFENQIAIGRLVVPLAFTAGTVGALALSLHKPRAAAAIPVLRPWERYMAWLGAIGALCVLLACAWRLGDWWAAPAFIALAALWIPVSADRGGNFVSRSHQVAAFILFLLCASRWSSMSMWLAAVGMLPAACLILLPTDWWQPAAPGTPVNESSKATREVLFRLHYSSMAFALLLVVAIIPAYSFGQDARAYAWTGLARFGRATLDAAAEARRQRVREKYIGEKREHSDPAEIEQRLASVRDGIINTSWTEWDERSIPGLPPDQLEEPGSTKIDSPSRLLSSWAMPWLPVFASPSPEMRSLLAKPPDDSTNGQTHTVNIYCFDVPTVSTYWLLFTNVCAVVAALIGFFLIWSVARLIFLLDVDRGQNGSSISRGTLNAWQYTGRKCTALPVEHAGPKQELVDLRLPMSVQELTDKAKAIADDPDIEFVEVDHPASLFDDPELHTALLTFLEKLMRGRPKTIVLTSDVDPLHWAFARELEWGTDDDDAPATDKGADAKEKVPAAAQASTFVGRWARLLSEFSRSSWQVPASKDKDEAYKETSRILAAKYPTLSEGIVGSADDPRHWTIWRQCTRAEKLALRQLADEGFLNPNSIGVVRRLSERLLVFRDPAWSLMTPSFRHFVRRAATPEMVKAWEQKGERSGWAQLRAPLAAIAMIAGVYLVLAERETLNLTIAIVTGLVALLPALMKILGAMGEQDGARSG